MAIVLAPETIRQMSASPRRIAIPLLLILSLSSPPAAQARTASEALTKGHSYAIPAVTYCTGADALDALVQLRSTDDLDSLPPGCFRPGAARFAAQFKGFIPDHKITGIVVPEKLSRPNRFGQSTCPDPTSGASVKCDVRVIRSGFLAGTLAGADGSKTPAFIEVATGIEVIDPRSGALQFAPLAASGHRTSSE